MDEKTNEEQIREAVASGLRDKSTILYLFNLPAFTAIFTLIICILAAVVAYLMAVGDTETMLRFIGELIP